MENQQQRALNQEDPRIFAGMYHYITELYENTAVALASFECRNTAYAFSSNHVCHDPVAGQAFEFTTNTPFACSLQQLDECLWSHISKTDTSKKEGYAFFNVSHKRKQSSRRFLRASSPVTQICVDHGIGACRNGKVLTQRPAKSSSR